jgi:sialic acid synthase SpsE
MKEIKIGNFKISDNSKTYLIAEIGINHNGNIDTAKKLIKLAKKSGANAVKFQTFKAEKLVKEDSPQFSMFKKLELTKDMHIELINYSKELKIDFFSTPFDYESADLLNELDIKAFKIASSDLNNIPFLKYIAKFQKPIILSTGMATIEEILEAKKAIYSQNNEKLIVLHCLSLYPTPFEELNLNSILYLKDVLKDNIIGFSDHTEGILAPIIATVLGAKVIEKHFTFDNNAEGPDHKLSLNYIDFKKMKEEIKKVEISLGEKKKEPSISEKTNIINSRTSIISKKEIKKNEKLTLDNIIIKRPATGIEPKHLETVINKKINKNIKKDTPITWDLLLN